MLTVYNSDPYFQDENTILYHWDSMLLQSIIGAESVDMIFADPPYFLSNDGVTCKSGHMVKVNKAKWDTGKSDITSKHEFNRKWIQNCKAVLKPSGTIWISGTMHNIYSVGMALEQEGFQILNNITWQKTNPPPNLGCRCFTHSTETILWAKKVDKKAKHYYAYEEMKLENSGKQMKDVWAGPLTPPAEKTRGKHPTQKPLYLLERIIKASTQKDDLVLDPFCGSGTTGVAAKKLQRKFIGIDTESDYLEITKKRLLDYE